MKLKAILIGTIATGLAIVGTPASAVPGAIDTTFGGQGVVQSSSVPFTDNIAEAVLPSNGTVTVIGRRENVDTGALDGAVVRYLDNGTPDPSFGGGDGEVILTLGGPTQLYDGAILPDGRIVVVGQVSVNPTEIDYDFGIAVLTAAGDPDPNFSGDGVTSVSFGPGLDIAYGVTVDAQGRIVVVGRAAGVQLAFGVARLGSDGELDSTFHADGIRTISFPGGARAFDVAVRSGRIAIVGGANAFSRFGLARLQGDGSFDPTFGHNGKTTSKGSPIRHIGEAHAVAIQSDGHIVVAGGSNEFIVARYGPRGRPDPTFNRDGYVQAYPTILELVALDVVVQSSGRIVAVGGASTTHPLAITRFRANGRLDPSFSGDGRLFGSKLIRADFGLGAAIDASGRLLVAGGFRMACARYLLA